MISVYAPDLTCFEYKNDALCWLVYHVNTKSVFRKYMVSTDREERFNAQGCEIIIIGLSNVPYLCSMPFSVYLELGHNPQPHCWSCFENYWTLMGCSQRLALRPEPRLPVLRLSGRERWSRLLGARAFLAQHL